MRGLNSSLGAGDRERARNRSKRNFARHWSVPMALLAIAGCAAQDEQADMPSGGAATNGGMSSAGTSGAGGKASGGTSAGSGGAQAGMSGTAGANGGSSSGGTGGSADGGSAGTSMGGAGGATAGAGGKAGAGGGGAGGAGGSAGAGGKGGGGAGGMSGAGGKGGSGGTGGTAPVDPCDNDKKDANETDIDCGGVCTTKCATGKGCDDLTDCVAKNVCDASKCRADGCTATNCAYTLTRYIIGSSSTKGQVIVSWDNDSLDLKFEILDTTSFDDSGNNWEDDSIEIYLDLNNAKTTTYESNDFQVNVPRHAGNNVVGIGTNLNTGAVTVTRTTDAMGYTLIVGIPWSALNNAAYPAGKTIGFDIGVNDDSDGGTRNAQMMLYGFDQNYLNTSQFGTLTIP
jgi:hypothetical protein